jgi:hypothetical protein
MTDRWRLQGEVNGRNGGKDLLSGIDGCSSRDDDRAVKRQAETASQGRNDGQNGKNANG